MKIGDTIKATWSDGLVHIGKFICEEKGYIILVDKDEKKIVCSQTCVKFEVVND